MAKKQPRRASSRSARSSATDAIKLLKADHAKVDQLFKDFEKADSARRKQEIAATICNELKVHTTIEEEIFYPAAREALDEQDLLDEAEVEHASAKELIAQIESGSPQDELWDAKVVVLGEYIKHHVKEEHEEMFPKVKKSELDLKALGEQLQARKNELVAGKEKPRRSSKSSESGAARFG